MTIVPQVEKTDFSRLVGMDREQSKVTCTRVGGKRSGKVHLRVVLRSEFSEGVWKLGV